MRVDSVHPLVQAIAESENLSIEETLELLDKQHHSRETLKKAQDSAGVHFAGGWISEAESPVIAVDSPITKHKQHYVITAGHCGDAGHHIYQNRSRFLGEIDRSINNSHDSARVKVLGPWRATSWLWANHGWQSLTIVGKAKRNSSRRSVACFSGVTNGYRCGRIVNTRTSYNRWKDVWEADFQVEKGDSGGPVILPGNAINPTNIEAYGIVNAKDALNPFANYHSFGHHIDDVEQRLGVSIVTRK